MEPATSVGSRDPRRSILTSYQQDRSKRYKDRYWLHVLLFLLSLASTVYVGGEFVGRWLLYAEAGVWAYIFDGLRYGLSLLLFLTVHEFGHYFAARRHGVATSLPYFIPLPFMAPGTLGAVIRIREAIPNMRKLFDIGAGGPIAGFVIALALLLFALVTLPPPSYVFDLPGHDALKYYIEQNGEFPAQMPEAEEGSVTIVVGQTLLYWLLTQFFDWVPPMWEMYHYPILFASWLGLFFTALNLLPVGQLDGGHILYALFGRKWHGRLARGFFMLLLLSGSVGFIQDTVPFLYDVHQIAGDAAWFILAGILFFYLHHVFRGDLKIVFPSLLGIILLVAVIDQLGVGLTQIGYSGWFIWCLLIVFLIKIDHPPVLIEEELTPARKVVGFLSILIFVLCFSFKPLYLVS